MLISSYAYTSCRAGGSGAADAATFVRSVCSRCSFSTRDRLLGLDSGRSPASMLMDNGSHHTITERK